MSNENELVEEMLELGYTPLQVKLALEDGEWLEAANISEAEAEAAHAAIVALIRKNMH